MVVLRGKITKGLGGLYAIRLENGFSVNACCRGNIRKMKIVPAIGDNVDLVESGDPDVEYVIERIHSRKSFLVRPPVANVDSLILCFAVREPEPDLKTLDKLLIICGLLNIIPVIVFTKADLDYEYAQTLYNIYSNIGFKCYLSDVDNKISADDLLSQLSSTYTYGFAGPSGVGKSTLCNALLNDSKMPVGDISERLKRGKHTTRHVELFDFHDGFLVDTPGFTSLNLYELGVDYKEVIEGYPEIKELSKGCRFDDCRHISERECAVIDSIGEIIDSGRYERYVELEEELYILRNEYKGRRKFYNDFS